MNSPPEPASPVSSASSDSVVLDDDMQIIDDVSPTLAIIASSATATVSDSTRTQAKRRLPQSAGAASRDRDPKARRREDSGLSSGKGDAKDNFHSGRGQREDWLDLQLAEHLRRTIGDPFDDDMLVSAS